MVTSKGRKFQFFGVWVWLAGGWGAGGCRSRFAATHPLDMTMVGGGKVVRKVVVIVTILLAACIVSGCSMHREVVKKGSHFEVSDINFGNASLDSIYNVRRTLYNRYLNLERTVIQYDSAGMMVGKTTEIVSFRDSIKTDDAQKCLNIHTDSLQWHLRDSAEQCTTSSTKVEHRANLISRGDMIKAIALVILLIVLVKVLRREL